MSPHDLDTLRVVCAVEGEAFVPHCAAMLHSLLTTDLTMPIEIEYLHGPDTGQRRRERLRSMVLSLGGDIRFHPVADDLVRGLPARGFTGKATWYRIFLPGLLPETTRALYLDLDVLVLDSLLELWHTPLGDHLLAAVSNVAPREHFERPLALGLPDRRAYFNAGVLLLDLERMRAEHVTDRLRAFSVRNALRLGWRDQDALNAMLHQRRLPLHPRWNCMNALLAFPWAKEYFSASEIEEAGEHPAIRHFEGPAQNKPWHLLSDREWRDVYVRHRRATPWPRVRPAGATPANILRLARGTEPPRAARP